jgi:hypothetical protein
MLAVETFECTETAAEPIEATEEAVALMTDLGLDGQLQLVRHKTEQQHAARSPYRLITGEESFIYGTLCPEQVPLEQYRAGPIPLRVLQIASHVKALGICKRLEVWDKVSAVVQDPVLVGHAHDRYEYNSDKIRTFILARWGEVLETFSTLRKQALSVRREQLIQQAQSIAKQAEGATDEEVMRHISVQW